MSTDPDGGGDENAREVSGEALEEAFGLVANELRFEIVEALWEAELDGETSLSFSGLRERVGVRDSGRFNYHLDELTPRFVRDGADGYGLTHAGRRVVGAAVSGTYTDGDVTVEPVSAGECADCGGEVQAAYDQGSVVIECADCEMTVADGLPAPPVLAAHHEPAELPRVFNRLALTRARTLTEGFCTLCGGPTDSTPLPFLDEHSFDANDDDQVGVANDCRACGREVYVDVAVSVLEHPAVVAFHDDHDVDLRSTPLWELDWLAEPHATVESEDPPRVGVEIALDDEVVALTLDDDCTVLDHERRES